MALVSLTGSDTAVINGTIMTGVADGDYCTLAFDNDLAKMKTSKDGNTIYALDQTGRIVKVTMRVLLGSDTDVTLNSLLSDMLSDFASFSLMSGSFTKRVGDGSGKTHDVVYQLTGGIFKRWPNAKSNAEGDTDQSVAVYEIDFLNNSRSIQ